MQRKTTIEIGGEEYEAVFGKIAKAHLGWEDHGIFTAYLTFEGPSWGQGEPARAWSAFHLKIYLDTVMKTLGVRDWSEVSGQEVFVLRKGGIVVGFAHRTEQKYMLFQQVADITEPATSESKLREAVHALTEPRPRNPAEVN